MNLLRQLVINDLAVIDSLNIDFKPGMTVLTGETGAGKSILLDALGLVLGDRADTSIIRGGSDKTDITAIFSIDNNPYINDRLNEMEIASDDELFIRRTITKDGRSRAYLNNTPVPVQTLREVGEYLVDIHGQHAHQSLSRPKAQREILDQAGTYDSLLKNVADNYHEWKLVDEQLQNFETSGDDFEARLSFLKYQIDELTQLDIGESEYETLVEEFKRQSHAQDLIATCQQVLAELSESDSAIYSRLAQHKRAITDLCRIDNSLEGINSLLDSAAIQIDEACSELKDYIDRFDSDISQLNIIERRLDKINELARKHKVKPGELPEQLILLSSQLNQLEGGQEQHGLLQKKKNELLHAYKKLAKKLSEKRKSTANKIASAVTDKMQDLGMGGEFDISLEPIEALEVLTPHQFGMDKISFIVSTNPGQPLRPIAKVASGGELSRLSLAIQIIASKDNGVPTMVFDEVDAGISGGIAEIVGKLLNSLAEHRQIFCVTHLAQVASCGHHHLRVIKESKKEQTFTQVIELAKQERIDEVARMLAGMEVTHESRANAAQMLESGL
ncbi:MAG: DNA repair protein RecN [marine bacterium B5-7]|nr:MAG: DNA repair protein RecN [marine bacterium B5-7]